MSASSIRLTGSPSTTTPLLEGFKSIPFSVLKEKTSKVAAGKLSSSVSDMTHTPSSIPY